MILKNKAFKRDNSLPNIINAFSTGDQQFFNALRGKHEDHDCPLATLRLVWGRQAGGFILFHSINREIRMRLRRYLHLPMHHGLVQLNKHFLHYRSFLTHHYACI